ncbi:MAG: MBL fold metallo-hydrolase [Chloroflexota bacterium]
MSALFRMQSLVQEKILEIVPNIYQLTYRAVNVVLIVEDELTLIDTGFRANANKIIDFIRSLGHSPEELSLIFITHKHFDHAGGLASLKKLTKARVAAHRADLIDNDGRPHTQATQKSPLVSPLNTLRSVYSLKTSDVDVPLSGGEVFQTTGGLQVIHTPGHTPGSISLFSPRHRLLIVGDALSKFSGVVSLPRRGVTGDLKQATNSIRKMAELDFNILCLGHGLPLTGDARAQVQQLTDKIKN